MKHVTFILSLLAFFVAPVFSQSSPGEGPWSGFIQCKLDVEQPGYSRHEIQTWTLTGQPPRNEGMWIHAATWTYAGGGSVEKVQPPQTTNFQWNINAPPSEATLAMFVRGRDKKFIIRLGYSPRPLYNAVIGTRQITLSGIPQRPGSFSFPVTAWSWPWIEATPGTNVSGSMSMQTESLGAELTQPGGPPSAVCKYQFSSAGTSPGLTSVAQNCPQTDGIARMFDNMKANANREFAALMQQTQDPSKRTALNTQKQKLLDDLENLKQQNLNAASTGCNGSSGGTNSAQNPPAVGTMGQNSGQTSNGTNGTGQSQTGNASAPPPDCSQAIAAVNQQYDVLVQQTRSQYAAAIQDATRNGRIVGPSVEEVKAQRDQDLAALAADRQNALAAAEQACQSGSSTNAAQNSPPPGASGTNSGQTGNTGQTQASSGPQRSPAPQLLKVTPSSAEQNTATLQVALTGQGTHWLMGTTKLDFGPGITVQGQPVFLTATDAYVAITVASTAAVGPRTVTVTSPFPGKTETVALPNSFTVTAKFIKQRDASNVPTNTPLNVPAASTPPIDTTALKNSRPPKNLQPAGPTLGNYLVTITHLRCINSTLDDPTDRDGKGNEIYAAVWVRRYDRSGNFLEQRNAQSLVYGDTRNQPPQARIQAGSLSPTGGIGSNDNIPAGATDTRWGSPSDYTFPLKLWQGSLFDGGDVLVISPTIWESDDDQSVYAAWGQTQNALGNTLWNTPALQDQIRHQIFGPIVLGNINGVSGNLTQTAASTIVGALGLPVLGIPARSLFGQGYDRPMGLIPNGADATALPNVTVVLTREIIEAALSGASAASGGDPTTGATPPTNRSGVMVIDFKDTFRPGDWSSTLGASIGLYVSPGRYQMVLQIERVGGTNQASSTTNSDPSHDNVMENMKKAAESLNQTYQSTNAQAGP